MPNHVINEIVFRGVDAAQQSAVLTRMLDADGYVDFGILVPIPPQVWLGSVGIQHDKLGKNALDWSRENWGTKWNAYGQRDEDYAAIEQTEDMLTVRFQTAWSPPYGWIVAVFNSLEQSFDHNWLSEGQERGVSGKWDFEALRGDVWSKQPWAETECDDEMHKHLHKLLWGVEEFEDDAA